MYNFEEVSKACLMIADELMSDKSKEAKKIVDKIDSATKDAEIKAGIIAAVKYLEKIKKFHIADDIRKKTTGFAF